MLTSFRVRDFKNFQGHFEFDLSSTKNYEFNKECIKNNVVRVAQVYGPNASGKTNLGLAIFDIVSHMTDNQKQASKYKSYINGFSKNETAEFVYTFNFDGSTLIYKYSKSGYDNIVSESLKINDDLVILFDRESEEEPIVSIDGASNLVIDKIKDSKISIVKYVAKNTLPTDSKQSKTFRMFVAFVDQMLFFRNVDRREYLGFEVGSTDICDFMIKNDHLHKFELFLNAAGIICKLGMLEDSGEKKIAFIYGDNKLPFIDNASTGTLGLLLLFFWLKKLEATESSSLVFIDEFDAFYHFELSESVVNELKKITKHQVILTTHNTALLTNEISRPDCNFIMRKETAQPISKSTDKELREAHNIEKMYRANAFNE